MNCWRSLMKMVECLENKKAPSSAFLRCLDASRDLLPVDLFMTTLTSLHLLQNNCERPLLSLSRRSYLSVAQYSERFGDLWTSSGSQRNVNLTAPRLIFPAIFKPAPLKIGGV